MLPSAQSPRAGWEEEKWNQRKGPLPITFSANKSLSKLCPMRTVSALNMFNRTAWTSRNVTVTSCRSASVTPENLRGESWYWKHFCVLAYDMPNATKRHFGLSKGLVSMPWKRWPRGLALRMPTPDSRDTVQKLYFQTRSRNDQPAIEPPTHSAFLLSVWDPNLGRKTSKGTLAATHVETQWAAPFTEQHLGGCWASPPFFCMLIHVSYMLLSCLLCMSCV